MRRHSPSNRLTPSRRTLVAAVAAAVLPVIAAAEAGSVSDLRKPPAAPGAKAVGRDPFWPVGYVPAGQRVATPAPPPRVERPTMPVRPAIVEDWDSARKLLSVTGVGSTGQDAWSIVNKRVVKAGDTVSVILEGMRYQWRVASIGPNGPVFEQLAVGRVEN